MARTAQQKLQAFRRQRGTPTRVSATDKLRKYRGLQKEEDDDESFVDQIGDLGKRIWYGETEDHVTLLGELSATINKWNAKLAKYDEIAQTKGLSEKQQQEKEPRDF